ncbi:hypothetical protein LTR91_002895 [Friedmanniomyces endolithicus]|uniref:RING-type domain-containing protein n=1 Tax=Friedmanniomyces endolithicus TaxID=329885 RepID=A0AAN6L088_9PEZI|nr:hypothetical protein LTR57_004550 [Friedmanniomyces endolithicus]KAK0978472.1 hypothetical protein LTS01_012746 [Friedmanniomyces endolithicus]KAK1009245.1 hypothetical protein LTR91_002895 [Friedmanniomyces endolithicus]KAK1040280.1 hypothetical protein LTS16_010495 [Friedmanniomyces endolithicus]
MADEKTFIVVPGLTEEQRELLANIKVGDLVHFQKVFATPPSAHGGSESAGEPVEDRGEEADDELTEMGEHDHDYDVIVTSAAGSEYGRDADVGDRAGEAEDEVDEDLVMNPDQGGASEAASEGDKKVSDTGDDADGERHGRERKILMSVDEAGAVEVEDALGVSNDESNRSRKTDDNPSEDGLDARENADVRTVAESESDVAREAGVHHEENTENTDVDEDDSEIIDYNVLYYVHSIIKTDNIIVDVDLIMLHYQRQPYTNHPRLPHTFQLHGSAISHQDLHDDTCFCGPHATTLYRLSTDYNFSRYTISLNPTGDFMRDNVANSVLTRICPTACENGFVETLAELASVLDSSVYTSPALIDHQIVCPVCIGLPLLMEQQALRATLDQTSYVDLSAVVDWYGRLAPRRAQLGYPFHQFDEREWGYLFDDMPPSDHDDESDFEQLSAEMMDPNHDVPTQPASREAIAALPRKTFAEVENPGRAGESCIICQENFGAEAKAVEMPCGHVFHEGECIEQWLGFNSHQCPSCRAELPVAEGGEVQGTEAGEESDGEEDDEEEDGDESKEDDEELDEIEAEIGELEVEIEEIEVAPDTEW